MSLHTELKVEAQVAALRMPKKRHNGSESNNPDNTVNISLADIKNHPVTIDSFPPVTLEEDKCTFLTHTYKYILHTSFGDIALKDSAVIDFSPSSHKSEINPRNMFFVDAKDINHVDYEKIHQRTMLGIVASPSSFATPQIENYTKQIMPQAVQLGDGTWKINTSAPIGEKTYKDKESIEKEQKKAANAIHKYLVNTYLEKYMEEHKNEYTQEDYAQSKEYVDKQNTRQLKILKEYGIVIDSQTGEFTQLKETSSLPTNHLLAQQQER